MCRMKGCVFGRVFFGSVSLSRDKEMNSPAVRETASNAFKNPSLQRHIINAREPYQLKEPLSGFIMSTLTISDCSGQ